ncbi:MAG: serine/threonine-protein phosphatase, partial [Anaerolineae bacterium]|nr:serine/threonine-protein phosphatase [Anaerolineae bacterium]
SVTDFEKYLSLVGEEDEHRQHVETMIASLRVQLKADESGRDSGLLTGLFFRPQGQSDAKSESGDSEGSNLPGELPASSPGENRGITKQENRSLQSVMVAVMLLAVLAIVSIIVGLLLRPDATTANDTSSANQFTPVLAIMVVVGTVLFIGWRIWFDIQRRAQQDDSVVSPGFSATAATQRTMIPESATRPPSRPSGLPSLSAASESTALDMMYEGATRPLPPPAFIPDHKTSLVCGLATDVGLVRSNNQDACVSFVRNVSDYEDLPNFGLFIVADGMGGHHDGEKASSLAIRTIESEIINTVYLPLVSGRQDAERPPLSEMLNSAVKKANALVVEQVPDGGTTVTAAMIVGNLMHIAHVGDSRAYLVTRESIEQITRD